MDTLIIKLPATGYTWRACWSNTLRIAPHFKRTHQPDRIVSQDDTAYIIIQYFLKVPFLLCFEHFSLS